MYRWIIGGLLLALILLIALTGRGGHKTSYVNGLPLYTKIPGREYIFERDCYIFKFTNADSDWPYVGAHATVPDLPITVDAKDVGATIPGVRILDVVETGTRFRIVSVRRDQTQTKSVITFEILFSDEAHRKYPRVDAYYMLDQTEERPDRAPQILADYAVPRSTNKLP